MRSGKETVAEADPFPDELFNTAANGSELAANAGVTASAEASGLKTGPSGLDCRSCHTPKTSNMTETAAVNQNAIRLLMLATASFSVQTTP